MWCNDPAIVPAQGEAKILLGGAQRDRVCARQKHRKPPINFTAGCENDVILKGFQDGYLPYEGSKVKDFFEELKLRVKPDVIFTHWNGDAHQDHRLVSELTWNTFRNHLILEYEIPNSMVI